DKRIGPKFLHPGPGYGGSCFPKDTLAFVQTAREAGAPQRLIEAVIEVNEARKAEMADRVIAAFDGDVAGKTVAVLGLAFKQNTDDMRDAPSLTVVPALQRAGARVRAYDPAAMKEARRLLTDIDYATGAYEALRGADGAVLLTEWNEFRALDPARMIKLMGGPVFVDLRNVYKPADMQAAGFRYHSIGRPVPGSAG
ncbi:MAG TPA: UDP binding domain-containing protein, partial [Inquilinus sp.]